MPRPAWMDEQGRAHPPGGSPSYPVPDEVPVPQAPDAGAEVAPDAAYFANIPEPRPLAGLTPGQLQSRLDDAEAASAQGRNTQGLYSRSVVAAEIAYRKANGTWDAPE